MIKIALVDDEETSAMHLKGFIERYEQNTNEKIEVRWFQDGLAFLDEFASDYDVIFMDIDMPNLNGMETAKELRKRDPMVALIFVSIMVQFAIEGYSVDAMDFLVKPVSYLKFSMKLEKAINFSKKNKKIIFKLMSDDGITNYVAAHEIYYVESFNHYLNFHTSKGIFKRIGSISKIEQQLAEFGFLRSDISFVVNPAFVTKLGKDFMFINEQKIPISRNRRKDVTNKLTSYQKFIY